MKLLKITIIMLLFFFFNSCTNNGLDIENDKEIKIVQRGSKIIKGSEGDVELIINDITNGSTQVKIESIEDNKTFYKDYLKEGEYGIFKYGDLYYRVKINSIEEHVFHDDFAFIALRSVSEEKGKAEAQVVSNKKDIPISPDEIRTYLNKVKKCGLKFIRNGKTIDDSTMSHHLENKYIINNKDIKMRSDFIKKIVEKSSLTGETYKVITNNSDTISITEWLKL